MMKRMLGILAGFVLTGVLTIPAWSADSQMQMASPGTLNYVEGQASIGNEALNQKSVGLAELQTGQALTTGNGKAEVLLTPGIYLRLGDNSSAKMISPDLTNTKLAVNRGEAMVEVDEIYPENDINITEDGTDTRLLKTGLYDFDAAHDQVRVFSGRASVLDGDRQVTVKGGHELTLNAPGKLKAKGFDKNEYAKNDDLYRWSNLRSDYLAEANASTAQIYVDQGWYGPGWFGAGWYWSPWFSAYTFIPEDGFLYSPFGWGFYSPLWAYRAPLYGFNGRYFHHFDSFRPEAGRPDEIAHRPIYGPGFRGGEVHSFGNSVHGFHPGASLHGAVPFSGFHGGSIGGYHGGFSGGSRH